MREQNERQLDQRIFDPNTRPSMQLPGTESPCVRVDRIRLTGDRAQEFQWAVSPSVLAGSSATDSPIGRCLGTAAVNIVSARVQGEIIARGWTTTRVLVTSQDLSSGELLLTLVPGRIAAMRLSADSSPSPGFGENALLASAIPAATGDLLNLRAVEQGLENLRRAPTVEADVQIEPSLWPGALPGDSDLVVKRTQTRPWRLSFNLDDSGTRNTGRYQGTMTWSFDNPLGLNDLLYASGSHNLDGHLLHSGDRGTEGQTLHYSVPYGWWLWSMTASRSRYHQTVAGLTQDYVYAGQSENEELKLTRLIWRDQHRKTSAAMRVWRRTSRSLVDDAEIDAQRRAAAGWEGMLLHKEFIDTQAGLATVEASAAYRHGTGAFASKRAPEEAYGEGTSHMRLLTADLNASVPFEGLGQKLRWNTLVRLQAHRTRLLPQDLFAIGGRYSVRGFDGESSLMAEKGWLVRNDIGWAVGPRGAELYVGLDHGRVGGPSKALLIGDRLTGAVVGARGVWDRVNYDFFIGTPLRRPEGFRTARWTSGFNLALSF